LRLSKPFIRLPFRFDAEQLAREVDRLPASSWMAHPSSLPGNSAVALISSGGGDNDSFEGEKKPTPHLGGCVYLRQVMASFGEVLSRSRLMKLDAGAEVSLHVDFNYHWFSRVRVHIPIITNESVIFHCGPEQLHMRAGECWIFDSWRRHRVVNPSTGDRIHLVIDMAGSSRFWGLVRRVENDDPMQTGAQARFVAFEPGKAGDIRTERFASLPVMAPGTGKTRLDYLWAIARDQRGYGGADPPIVVFHHSRHRSAKVALELMRGYTGGGPLHVDGYRVYDALGDPKQTVSPWVLAYCWTHWRRRFVDFQRATESPLCEEILERIAALYRIEAMVRGHPPELRLKARQELSAPIVEAMRPWLEAQLDRLSSASELAKHIRYALKRWDGLCRFLHDGRIEMDTNPIENLIRPVKTMESFCTPCSSIWKHWDLFPARGSMWMSPPPVGHGLGDILGMKVCNLDLPRRSGNDLPGGQLSHLDQTPDDMTGDAELLRGFEHGAPNAVLVGGEMGVNAVHAADRADPLGRPGLVLPGAHAHPVERCGDMVVGPPSCHVPHDGQGLIGGPASVLATPRLLNP